ncbi:MAG: hypothetical protein Q9226_001255, partial [Calogaya cf. arnoldii]
VGGIASVFSSNRTFKDPLIIGLVSTDVGLLTTILWIEKGIIPGTPTFIKPNPRSVWSLTAIMVTVMLIMSKVEFRSLKVRAPRTALPWPKSEVRRASVNSLSYRGSNAHVALEEPKILVGSAEPTSKPTVMLVLMAVFEDWGLTPQAVVGHSPRALAAACAAGYLSKEDALKSAFYRGQAAKRISPDRLLQQMNDAGYNFGPLFQKQLEVDSISGKRQSRSIVSFTEPESAFPQSHYPIHPACVDGCLQTPAPSFWKGGRSSFNAVLVPAIIDEVIITDRQHPKTAIADINSYSGSLLFRVSGLRYHKLDTQEDSYASHDYSRITWKPDITKSTQGAVSDLAKAAEHTGETANQFIDLVAHTKLNSQTQICNMSKALTKVLEAYGFDRTRHVPGEPSNKVRLVTVSTAKHALAEAIPNNKLDTVRFSTPNPAFKQLEEGLIRSGWELSENEASFDSLNSKSIVLVTDDLSFAVLPTIGEDQWGSLKALTQVGARILWVTEGSQLDVTKPDRAMAHGLFRTVRAEDPSDSVTTLDVESASVPTPWVLWTRS